MKNSRLIATFFLIGFLTACSKGLPIDKRDYVGYWKGENVSLAIQINGSVMYVDKTDSNKTKTIQGNIRHFEGDNFSIGFPPFDTQFNVSKPPYQDGAVKKMVVNEIELQLYQEPPEGNKTFSL